MNSDFIIVITLTSDIFQSFCYNRDIQRSEENYTDGSTDRDDTQNAQNRDDQQR